MNRVLEFRVWDQDTGYFLADYSNHLQYLQSQLKLTQLGSNANFGFVNSNLVVQQFTGLHDKNGKKIFEGDIIHAYIHEGSNKKYPFLVSYMKERAAFSLKEGNGEYFLHCAPVESLEVIGNIFENPELL